MDQIQVLELQEVAAFEMFEPWPWPKWAVDLVVVFPVLEVRMM